ncbi:MAG: copper chaperone PCu(A)C [Comamonadaceae bacterium]|nr:copper chaperone PCu(A)C [Comamonadaceae bacterium]
MSSLVFRAAAAALLCCGLGALAQEAPVEVSGAWVRATVPGQGGTGAYMTLQAPQDLQLVGVSTPVAGVAEVHEMKLEGNTMHMSAIPALALPAHQRVALAPGGYHLMLMDLKQALAAGSTVALTLRLTDAKGAQFTRTLQVPVRTGASAGTTPPGAMQHAGSHR